MPRTAVDLPWREVPSVHPHNETSHQENSRGIGLVDMAYAIKEGRAERASGAMALHSLEVMEGMLKSANDERFYHMKTTFERPSQMDLPK